MVQVTGVAGRQPDILIAYVSTCGNAEAAPSAGPGISPTSGDPTDHRCEPGDWALGERVSRHPSRTRPASDGPTPAAGAIPRGSRAASPWFRDQHAPLPMSIPARPAPSAE